jgi:VIT1/CCC1 family predicted Fe2+/Mn2+ transporter
VSVSLPPESPSSARDYPHDWLHAHIRDERRRLSVLGDVREFVFGAQDGLVSTLGVVAAVVAATNDTTAVVIAGLASGVAGIFSMAIGEYVGSKSQREIHDAQLREEREEVEARPFEAEAEVAYLFVREGMDPDDAYTTAGLIARYPGSLLATMVTKELGIAPESDEEEAVEGSPLQGALVMGGAFAAGTFVPVVPFLVTEGPVALAWAVALTAAVLFSIGAVKARWTARAWWTSGLEIVGFAAVAGVAGYLFGTLLPTLLGFADLV